MGKGYIDQNGYFIQLAEDFPPEGSPATQQAQAVAENPNSSPWDRISAGKTIGKSANILFPGTTITSQARVNLFEVRPADGANNNIVQLGVHISPPRFYNAADQAGMDVQTIEQFQGPFAYVGELVTNPPPSLTSAITPRLYMELSWGVGSVENTIEIDITMGAEANLGPASWARARVFMEWEQFGSPPPLIFSLSAAVGPARPKDVGCTRTVFVYAGESDNPQQLDTGDVSNTFAIPNFSRRMYLMGSNPDSTAIGTVKFFAGAGGQDLGQTLFAFNSLGWVPIPNGAISFAVLSGSDNSVFQAIFDLSV